jgi:hypothetical protein
MDNLQIIKSNFDSKSQVNSKSNKRKWLINIRFRFCPINKIWDLW